MYLQALDNGNSCFNTSQAALILNVTEISLIRRYHNKGKEILCNLKVKAK